MCFTLDVCDPLDMPFGRDWELYYIETRSVISNLPSGKYIEFCFAKYIDIYSERGD